MSRNRILGIGAVLWALVAGNAMMRIAMGDWIGTAVIAIGGIAGTAVVAVRQTRRRVPQAA